VKWLVTGGAGYVGSVVVDQLVAAGNHVVVLDDLSTGHADTVPAEVTLIRGRVHEFAASVLDSSFDGIVHLAASISAAESVRQPEKYRDNNVLGSIAVLEAARKHGVAKLLFSSTANIYGAPDQLPIPEEAPARPPNPYAQSKLDVEQALHSEATRHGMAAIALRYFNVAGAHRNGARLLGERHEPETHLIPLALRAASTGSSIPLYGDDYATPDRTCVRDYIHVTDIGRAHLDALRRLEPGHLHIYNLGNGHGFSNREVINAVTAVTGRPVRIEVGPRRPGDPPSLVADSRRAQAELGWAPRHRDLHGIVADAWEFSLRSRS
jgi:UDP-glucose 4-epimerase